MSNLGSASGLSLIGDTGNSQTNINSVNIQQAYGFFAPGGGKSLAKVYVYQLGTGGAPTAANLRCELRNSSAGLPGITGIDARTATSIPGTGGIIEFAGFTTALTAGNLYYIVLVNMEAAPGTNYINVLISTSAILNEGASYINTRTTDGGLTWNNAYANKVPGVILEYSDGTREGVMVSAINTASTGYTIYGNRASGPGFTTYANAGFNLTGVATIVRRTGNPGDLQARLYSTTGTLLATSAPLNQDAVAAGSSVSVTLYFPTPYTLQPATAYRLVYATEAASGDASNYWQIGGLQIPSGSAMAAAQGPMNGTWFRMDTTNVNSTPPAWADDTTRWPNTTLLGADASPYTATGGGGGGGGSSDPSWGVG